MKIKNYSEKSFIIVGDTKKVKNEIKEMGGKWCPKLKDKETDMTFSAWIFSNSKRDTVENWLNSKTEVLDRIKELENEIEFIKSHLGI